MKRIVFLGLIVALVFAGGAVTYAANGTVAPAGMTLTEKEAPSSEIAELRNQLAEVRGEPAHMEHMQVFPRCFKVKIDIKPCNYPNFINLKSKGRVAVAVLTTDDFDASIVAPATVKFAGAEPVRWTMEDIGDDCDLDMVFHFKMQELNLTKASTVATLTGNTWCGTHIWGRDTVNIVK